MQKGNFQGVAHFGYDVLHDALALGRLHAEPERAFKCRAVARHVYLGDKQHMMLAAKFYQTACFIERIEFSLLTLHVLCGIQLGIVAALKPPSLVLGQMPVEDIHLEAAQQRYLMLQLVQGDEAATGVVHESSHAESRPIGDFTLRQALPSPSAHSQLAHCLPSPVKPLSGDSLDGHPIPAYCQMISLVLKLRPRHLWHQHFTHRHAGLDILARKAHLLWLRKQLRHLSLHDAAHHQQENI